MKPYSQAQAAADPYKRVFNRLLSSERITLEYAFGQLKSRFQMLRVPIRVNTEMAPQFVVACFVLHNVGKFLNDNWDDDGKDGWGDNNNVPNEDDPLNPPGTGATAVRTAGQARREDIAAMISRFPANDPVN